MAWKMEEGEKKKKRKRKEKGENKFLIKCKMDECEFETAGGVDLSLSSRETRSSLGSRPRGAECDSEAELTSRLPRREHLTCSSRAQKPNNEAFFMPESEGPSAAL